MRVLLTGASGFVGVPTGRVLVAQGHEVIGTARGQGGMAVGVREARGQVVGPETDWTALLRGVDVVVHTAARVHVMRDRAADPLLEFRRVNVDGTFTLARQAARAGVKRFVFVSSIKVNGEHTSIDQAFRESDPPQPLDSYGVSKHEAEVGLQRLAEQGSMQLVVVRPPLVYGPGVQANFAHLVRAIVRGWPLPLASIRNLRSMVGVENLADLLASCVVHPRAAGQTFLVSDGDDVSTPMLARRIGQAFGRPARLIPVPMPVLEVGAALVGKRGAAQRLFQSLKVDSSRVRSELGWMPVMSMDQTLREMAAMKDRA